MNKALIIAASIAFALATAGCAQWATGSDGGAQMGAGASTTDAAGSATIGTGSVALTGEDRRTINASGMGLD